ncbi:6-phosphogluconate dehydrogenase C-terminal domain-like protein [Fistulina hepatica ATCC 64428]|uniref:6-phosphogluconate dehydrogenase C-terminal domain-like protein n=1 Tax=Fistulina hepatica ATCC 64428 TaxID=1128425 RepID=A0A0D7AAF2_9AGAR|nr:6-phosphogluconate dehydrogenase C-terminal domain-like protein [Fistulina hepatica ATCC 64428]
MVISTRSAISPRKEVLLVGLGPVGAIYAFLAHSSRLARVTVVARSNFDIVCEHGLEFQSRKFGQHSGWKRDRLCKSVSEAADTQYDYVLVATKCVPEVVTTPEMLAPLLSVPYVNTFTQPTYVLLQNGLSIENDLYGSLIALGQGPPRIVSAAVFVFANITGKNVIEHDDMERLVMGVYRHKNFTTVVNSREEQKLLDDLGSIFAEGGSTVEIVPEIQRRKYHKNMYNAVFASACILTRNPLTAFFRPPPSDPTKPYEPFVFPATADLINEHAIKGCEKTFEELLRLARALGFPDSEEGIPTEVITNAVPQHRQMFSTPWSFHKPSTLVDCEKGVPMEIEVIWGSVVRLAREHGVPVPRLEILYSLLLVIQNQLLRVKNAGRCVVN